MSEQVVNEICDVLAQDPGFRARMAAMGACEQKVKCKLAQADLSTEVPPEIATAAKLVTEWFYMQGVKRWEFMGLRSRFDSKTPIDVGREPARTRGLLRAALRSIRRSGGIRAARIKAMVRG